MARPTDEEIATLESQHRRVAVVHARDDAWCVVLRRPTRAEYKRLRAMSHDASRVADAQEVMFRSICVVPGDGGAIDALLDDYPGIPEACGPAMLELVGAAGSADAKP